ncbi:MAG: hypothetical protein LBO63_06990, partial [Oscillospiraceae bacterium]|nr:hypothetical protein [Oscillospiraceae bacterium]
MKKIVGLLLALLMVFSLVACGKTTVPDEPVSTPEASDVTTPAPTPTPAEDADVSATENAIGYFSSGVDPASRDKYQIVWAYMRPMALFQNIESALIELETKLNFKTTSYCANSDIDAMIQNIEIYADQGVDGFLIVIDPTASARIKEVLDGTGIPYVA